ncbi:MAG: hypothetical protein LC725_11410 [Lentisphaerae bacterium]|nr:hypothetical protein [Lentisphaerota bacterium]
MVRWLIFTLLSGCVLSGVGQAQSAAKPSGAPVVELDGVGMRFLSIVNDGQLIWDLSRIPDRENTNLEFPYIIRFKDSWYCAFREGDRHGNDPSGRARVITSSDGETWETAVLLEWQGGDIRDPRLSVTPDGQLMINSSVYFIGEPKPDPAPWEQPGKRQSVTWLSEDGVTWSEAYACPTGFDTWRWDVVWQDGVGYSAGYAGKDVQGTLYHTTDGRTWEPLVENFFPDGRGTEAALGFGADGTACCLLRPRGAGYGMFGAARPPYLEWQWQSMQIDAANNGEVETGEAFGRRTDSIVGGQKLLLLEDGRMIAITAKGGVDLFWVEPHKALFTRFARLSDSTTYPGLVEHNGELWLTNSQRMEQGRGIKSGIYLLRLKVPPRETLTSLRETAAKSLAVGIDGFGQRYQAELREALETTPAGTESERADTERQWSVRARLRKAIGDLQEALALRQKLEQAIAAAESCGRESLAGFGQNYQEQVQKQIPSLRAVLAENQAGISDAQAALAAFDDARAGWEQSRRMRARAESALERIAPLLHRW